MTYQVFYTGDLLKSDGSDTDVYGEECEPGHGTTLESGWLSPDWTRNEVYEDRDDVTPDEYDGDENTVSPAQWLAETVLGRLGAIEDNGDGTFYAADFTTVDWKEGVDLRIAAHAYGFTAEELSEASDLMAKERATSEGAPT